MEKRQATIHSGDTIAYRHSGSLGRGLWQPMLARVWLERAHSARTTRRRLVTAAERGTWNARHRLNGNGETAHGAQPLRQYSRTHSRLPGRGSSPMR
jgi:hypothetical protein